MNISDIKDLETSELMKWTEAALEELIKRNALAKAVAEAEYKLTLQLTEEEKQLTLKDSRQAVVAYRVRTGQGWLFCFGAVNNYLREQNVK